MRLSGFFVALMLFAACFPARAAQRDLTFSLDQGFLYDSNPDMVARGARTLRQSATTPSLDFTSKTPTSTLDVKTSGTQNIANLDGYKTTDLHGIVKLDRTLETWDAGLGLRGDYDTARSSELTTLGIVTDAGRRKAFSAAPDIAFKPSALDRISLSGTYSQTRYESRAYTDYHTFETGLDYTRVLTAQHRAFVATSFRRYQADENDERRVDSVSPTIGFLSDLTPRLKTRLSVGIQDSKESLPDTEGSWTWGSLYEAAIFFTGEQHRMDLSLSRSRQSYVNGDDALLTRLTFRERFQMTEQTALTFAGAYHRGDANGSDGLLKNRVEIEPGVAYRIAPQLETSCGYAYHREELNGRDEAANGQIIRIGLTYTP